MYILFLRRLNILESCLYLDNKFSWSVTSITTYDNLWLFNHRPFCALEADSFIQFTLNLIATSM